MTDDTKPDARKDFLKYLDTLKIDFDATFDSTRQQVLSGLLDGLEFKEFIEIVNDRILSKRYIAQRQALEDAKEKEKA